MHLSMKAPVKSYSTIGEREDSEMTFETVLTVISILCTIVSGIGAYKSIKYYQKNKQLMTYVHKNVAYSEIKNVIDLMTEILKRSSPHQGRGINREKEVSQLGISIKKSLDIIREQLSNENCDTILSVLNPNEVRDYIESLITSPVLPNKTIDTTAWQQFRDCETALYNIQNEIRKKLDESEEKISA